MAKTVAVSIKTLSMKIWRRLVTFWRKAWWSKTILIFTAIVIVVIGTMYGIARWYIASESNKPFKMGVSFIPDYSRALGVDPKANMDALIKDVGVRRFRLVSYWSDIEKQPGKYDFSDLDWQFQKAEAAHAKITLSIGLRQPRWPECHMPDWASQETANKWQPQLNEFMITVINRYKSSSSLESYQLENEFFNNFGQCPDHDRGRLVNEYALVKKQDSKHPVIVSKSNNFPGGAFGQPQPDIVGVSVYRRVWDAQLTHHYFNYPLPSWYYAFNAGIQKIVTGKDSVIHELQMEPWPPHGHFVADISLAEQDKSMNAQMFAGRIAFAKHTGMKSVDLWGSEWWYYRMVKHNDFGVWNEAKKAFAGSR